MEGSLVLPGYTLGRRLGSDESAMWLATEDATGRAVTLRLIAAETHAVRERLHAGTSLMKAIDHPHIVPLYEAVDVASGVVVVCGAASGGSLADALSMRGTLPPGEVVTACAPIAEAMAEIHPHGIIHGAITLDDVVFTLEGRPMLAGVGMIQLGAGPMRGASLGSLAPEVQAGEPSSPGADVYGLAAVAVVALTGYLPQLPLALPDIPPAVQAALARALERAPERRPDAGTLANALYAISDPEPVEIVTGDVEVTGTLPTVAAAPSVEQAGLGDSLVGSEDDVAAFMRQGGGRRSRRTGSDPRDLDRPDTDHGLLDDSGPAERRADDTPLPPRSGGSGGRAGGRRRAAGGAARGAAGPAGAAAAGAGAAGAAAAGESAGGAAAGAAGAAGAVGAAGGAAAGLGGSGAGSDDTSPGTSRRGESRSGGRRAGGRRSAGRAESARSEPTRDEPRGPEPGGAEPSRPAPDREPRPVRPGAPGRRARGRSGGADTRTDAPRVEPTTESAPKPAPKPERTSERADAGRAASGTSGSGTSGSGRAGSGRAEPPSARRKGGDSGDGGGSDDHPPRKLSRVDISRIAIVLAVLLLVAGAFVVVRQFMNNGDDSLPGADLGSPSTETDAPVDLCGGPQPAPTAAPPVVTDWTQEIQRLYALRAQAFEELDAELLCQVYSPTSAGLAEDAELMQLYADTGIHTKGLSFEVVTAELISQNGGRVVLEVTDRQPGYQLVDEDGEVVDEKAGKEEQTWQAELVPVGDAGGAAPTWRFG